MKKLSLEQIKNFRNNILTTLKWIVFSIVVGIFVGILGSLFSILLSHATSFRTEHPKIIYLLPFSGLVIVGLYHLMHNEKDTGTNLIISAVHSGKKLSFQTAPLIFISTILTHLFGGSAGREGAALQMGGSFGNSIGKFFRFDEKDNKIVIMCGMSAAFSAVFGTPLAATLFPLEMVTVGIMYYSALLPCVISSLTAHSVAVLFHLHAESYDLGMLPEWSIMSASKVTILALLCAVLSILFCVILHKTEHLYHKYFPNAYLRIFVGGLFIVLFTILVGSNDYNGAGSHIIEQCFSGEVAPESFLLKMIFTALTIGAGYKGGEIVPSFYIGATFGCLFGNLLGFSPALCAGIGLVSVFCGVTNSPITSLIISFELFGFESMPFFLIAVAFSYMFSGYFSLYNTQKIMYSKYKSDYINRTTNHQ